MAKSTRNRIIGTFILLIALVVSISPVLAITWGQPDTEHDNVGAMVVDYPDYGPYQICSGTLIHPQVFLTAGHCTFDLEDYGITTVWVNFDEYALNSATLLDVAEVHTHPDYNFGPASNPYDVAALVLAEPVTGIQPAVLPYEGFLEDLRAKGELSRRGFRAKFTVVGYGGSLDWPPPDIYYDDMRQFAQSEYRALLKSWLRMSQNQATDDGGTCGGDSGGPAFWMQPDGTEILVGVTSWGDPLCVASGFNYRVDTADTLDFIDAVIANLP